MHCQAEVENLVKAVIFFLYCTRLIILKRTERFVVNPNLFCTLTYSLPRDMVSVGLGKYLIHFFMYSIFYCPILSNNTREPGFLLTL